MRVRFIYHFTYLIFSNLLDKNYQSLTTYNVPVIWSNELLHVVFGTVSYIFLAKIFYMVIHFRKILNEELF